MIKNILWGLVFSQCINPNVFAEVPFIYDVCDHEIYLDTVKLKKNMNYFVYEKINNIKVCLETSPESMHEAPSYMCTDIKIEGSQIGQEIVVNKPLSPPHTELALPSTSDKPLSGILKVSELNSLIPDRNILSKYVTIKYDHDLYQFRLDKNGEYYEADVSQKNDVIDLNFKLRILSCTYDFSPTDG